MLQFMHVLLLIICGIVLLWFGFYMFFGPPSPFYPSLPWSKKKKFKGNTGSAKVCPVCSTLLLKGDLIKTVVFPPATESSIDRLMYIKGCYICLNNNVPRRCPVCKAELTVEDFLVARMFKRPFAKNHVHVLGCNRCRKV
ncbi:hypothetical protein R84B8_03122 [Treponema sp. R8-4-B8]